MSKIGKLAKQNKKTDNNEVVNYMNGISYRLNPLDTLKMIATSSIFGEPSYYRGSRDADPQGLLRGCIGSTTQELKFSLLKDFFKDENQSFSNKTTEDVFEEAVNKALDFDFKSVLDFAVELRHEYYMRLNPQVIMVLASKHIKRPEFNKTNPGYFKNVQAKVMSRGDEATAQLAYYLYKYGSKNNLPNILKRTWKSKLESLSRYEINKYKNTHLKMIDTVRISHASSDNISDLLNNRLEVEETEVTWNQLRSEGHSWRDILNQIRIPYFALLKNLRGISLEYANYPETPEKYKEFKDNVLSRLSSAKEIKNSKLFPYRFDTVHKELSNADGLIYKKEMLEEVSKALQLSLGNLPKLTGKVACLSDNSGSAWGTIPTEYGSKRVAEIGNLSSVITAMNSDEGYVYTFGDKLIKKYIPSGDILSTLHEINRLGKTVGGATETGVFTFFRTAITKKEHFDHVFIYSDMQAGTKGCFDTKGFRDLSILVDEYRNQVNPKINIYTIQTAGYDNNIVPIYRYRETALYGWTGKEVLFADKISKQWDELDQY